jgi:alkaline phosphatase
LLSWTAAATDTTATQIAEAGPLTDYEVAALADSARWYLSRLSDRLEEQSRVSPDSTLVSRYTTGSHTAQMVPLFASGPGAQMFGGIKSNWKVGELLLEIVRR